MYAAGLPRESRDIQRRGRRGRRLATITITVVIDSPGKILATRVVKVMAASPSTPPPAAPRRNRNWIWYFLVLILLCAAAISTMIIYNLSQQLTPEQLEQARAKWQEFGPKNYELRYTKKIGASPTPDRYLIKVANGFVEEANMLDSSTGLEIPIDSAKYEHLSMKALLRDIARFMEIDHEPKARRTFTRAIFHPQDGHLQWYVRRVMGTQQRVEIVVEKFRPLPAAE